MYKWAKFTPQITAKLLECYEKGDFSGITWWEKYKTDNPSFYRDGLLDLQALWTHFGRQPQEINKKTNEPYKGYQSSMKKWIRDWNRLIRDLGISEDDGLSEEDFPRVNGRDTHGIPALTNDCRRPCRNEPGIIPKMWELISAAKRYVDDPDDSERFISAYDTLCSMKITNASGEYRVTSAFLSKILFISFPAYFVTIDGNTKNKDGFEELSNVTNGCEYLNACRSVKAKWKSKRPEVPDDEVLVDLSVYAYFGENG